MADYKTLLFFLCDNMPPSSRKLSVPQKGINIIRNSDGSNRKVLVK